MRNQELRVADLRGNSSRFLKTTTHVQMGVGEKGVSSSVKHSSVRGVMF